MATGGVIARNVRHIRSDSDMSIRVLSERSGLSKQTVMAIEAGRGNPTIDTIDALADALGVSSRALLTEMGTEVLVQASASGRWQEQSGALVRQLDQAFGSGYVFNTILRLHSEHGTIRFAARSRGALRHCFVAVGRVRLGPETAPVAANTGDFIRFPADTAHVFEALTASAEVFVCTTTPQLSMSGGDRLF